MIKHGAHAPVAGRNIAQRRRKELKALFDFLRDLLTREHARPSRGQLDSERQPLDQPADADDGRPVAADECEIRPQLACALHEELDRALRFDVRCRGRWQVQPTKLDQPLILQVEPLP